MLRTSLNVSSGQALGLLGRNGAREDDTDSHYYECFSGERANPARWKTVSSNSKNDWLPSGGKGLYADISLIRQLVYLGMLRGLTHDEAVQSSDYWLDRLSMTGYREQNLETLSKGNQQKFS